MTKSKRYLKKLVEHVLVVFFLLCLPACSPSKPKYTYNRKNIETSLVNICGKEFNVKPVVREAGDTIWVYVPLNKILTEKKTFDNDANTKMRQIFTALKRVILSMEKRPKFYAFVFSDIKTGADLYYIGTVLDIMKVDAGMISLSEWQEREVFTFLLTTEAIGDALGKHITMPEMEMGNFLAYLIKQNLERKLTDKEMVKNFKTNDLYSYYADGRLSVILDVTPVNKTAVSFNAGDEIKKSIRRFLKIYDAPEINSFEINDIAHKNAVFYSRKALLEGN
jgi:hypothetical protein